MKLFDYIGIMKLALAGVLVMSLVLAMVLGQHAVYASTTQQQKTINILVLLNGKNAAGAACTVLTNAGPIAIKTKTDRNGQASVSVPSSATTADITCTLNSYQAQGTFQLTQQTTSVIMYLK